MDFVSKIREELYRETLSPRLVLGKCQLVDHTARIAPAFTDHRNLPFYYYLGKYLPRDAVLNLGFGLGLPLIFYSLSHKAKILAQHDPGTDFYSPRLGAGNFARVIKKKIPVFVGKVSDEKFNFALKECKWGTVIINTAGTSFDSIMYSLNTSWDHLSDDGYICVDYSGTGNAKNAAENFSRLVNRKSHFVASRYGHSIIFKDN